MSIQEELRFKVSSALKDIIGRDLITDDFIAVFELVKNSFDAYATRVDVYFENLHTNTAKIIIKDNGKGMAYNDLVDKWLFVAYSAKKEGTEDEDYDYRNNINTNRAFAGAKGIGRFSCDRLGKQLYLETTKQENNGKTEVLITDWEKFEVDIKSEFVNISVLHESKSQSDYGLIHGTVLEISSLRSEWDRQKLLKLKSSLAKLINPNSSNNSDFSIYLNVPEELEMDNVLDEDYQKVNGEIRNFIFDTLGLKTTKIICEISEDGTTVDTELRDGGTLIYKIKERNQYGLLKNLKYTLYYLNMSAKATFARRMGLPSIKFGHIFLYKNGFRVYPYGEPGEDPLKIDARKGQGQRRYLGTRELIGQIEILDNNDQLKETSSRGDGLIKTPTYLQFEECFLNVLKRLEKYVVEVQEWGLSIEDENTSHLSTGITNLIAKLSGGENILEFEYSENFFEIIQESQSDSANKIINNLNRIAFASGDENLIIEAKRAARSLQSFQLAKQEAEKNESTALRQKKEIENELKLIITQNLLLKEASNTETVEILSIEHHINQATHRVDKFLQKLIAGITQRMSIDELISIANAISLENRKIASLVNFVRKANFDTMSSYYEGDILAYITEYIENIYKEDKTRIINNTLIDVVINFDPSDHVIGRFIPLEINIILDNLLDNSFKAFAKEAIIHLRSGGAKTLYITYEDNGLGIDPKLGNKIFEFGFTTTGGSGIGLFHIKKLLEDNYDGYIKIIKDIRSGVAFDLKLTVR